MLQSNSDIQVLYKSGSRTLFGVRIQFLKNESRHTQKNKITVKSLLVNSLEPTICFLIFAVDVGVSYII